MPTFPRHDPRVTSAGPDQGLKSAEYELADQDVDSRLEHRPDQRPPRGNPGIDHDDVIRGQEKLDRVIAK